MKYIWLIIRDYGDESEVEGVFDSEDKAKAAEAKIVKYKPKIANYIHISKHEVL
jgi:hypothetical protein